MSANQVYQPPCTISSATLRLAAEIAEKVGRLAAEPEHVFGLRLHRLHRIWTIQGSLAIEGNTLSVEQITAILDGKRVLAPPKEIQEAKGAIEAYQNLEAWRPHSEKDLLKAHAMLMAGVLDEAGVFRTGDVGVLSGNTVIHMGPPAKHVPGLMRSLLDWLHATDHHPLIASSVFHYEFEFIHPFADGNGRLGRLWQTLILFRWNPLFAHIPVESLVYEHQAEYYEALRESTRKTDSAPFIEFMLGMVMDALNVASAPEVTPDVAPEVGKMLRLLLEGPLSRKDIQARLGLRDEKHFRLHYQQPAVSAGLMAMTIPDKPNSRLQKYRLTSLGRRAAQEGSNGG